MNIPIHRVFDMRTSTSIGATLVALALLPSPSAAQTRASTSAGDSMTISRRGSRPVQPGPAAQFTGTARVEPLFAATDTSRANGGSVTFAPGARSAWHTHPRGQAAHWLSEWAALLEGPAERVLEVLTSPTPWAREMRQNSPFAGVLDEDERRRVLTAYRAHEASGTRAGA